jgi:hypothetical protein
MLNLTHRDSRTEPSALEPGTPYEVQLELEAMAWTFEAGHSIRLDLAGADWPNAWAPPEAATLTFDRSTASLELPVLQGRSPVAELPHLPPPNPAEANTSPKELRKDDPEKGWVRWSVEHHQLEHETRAYAGSFGDHEAVHDGDVPSFAELYDGVVSVSTDDPGRARSESKARFVVRFPEATCEATTRVRVTSDRHSYEVSIELVAAEDGEERWRRSWARTFPRDLA